jgi:hypothetical protein
VSYARKRFLSIWNGVATIVFFAGIILGFSYLGYSGLILGLFMWIIGGIIAGILFGPEETRKRRERSDDRNDRESGKSVEVPVDSSTEKNQFCIACGTQFPVLDQFCPQCGTAAAGKSVPS